MEIRKGNLSNFLPSSNGRTELCPHVLQKKSSQESTMAFKPENTRSIYLLKYLSAFETDHENYFIKADRRAHIDTASVPLFGSVQGKRCAGILPQYSFSFKKLEKDQGKFTWNPKPKLKTCNFSSSLTMVINTCAANQNSDKKHALYDWNSGPAAKRVCCHDWLHSSATPV